MSATNFQMRIQDGQKSVKLTAATQAKIQRAIDPLLVCAEVCEESKALVGQIQTLLSNVTEDGWFAGVNTPVNQPVAVNDGKAEEATAETPAETAEETAETSEEGEAVATTEF